MKTWEAKVKVRWGDLKTVTVAAQTFAVAVQKVKQIVRRDDDCKRPEFLSLTLTANLDG